MTAEVRNISPPIPPEPITHDAVTPKSFSDTWAENKSRVIQFLSQGFDNSLSDGIILSELGDMISKIYASHEDMTEWQWNSFIKRL